MSASERWARAGNAVEWHTLSPRKRDSSMSFQVDREEQI